MPLRGYLATGKVQENWNDDRVTKYCRKLFALNMQPLLKYSSTIYVYITVCRERQNTMLPRYNLVFLVSGSSAYFIAGVGGE
jgi:hypothetical protein